MSVYSFDNQHTKMQAIYQLDKSPLLSLICKTYAMKKVRTFCVLLKTW